MLQTAVDERATNTGAGSPVWYWGILGRGNTSEAGILIVETSSDQCPTYQCLDICA